MPISFDGTQVPGSLPQMPCGGTPLFDVDSGYAYFCDTCFAILGSVSQRVVDTVPSSYQTALLNSSLLSQVWHMC